MRKPLIKMIFRGPFLFAVISTFILNGCDPGIYVSAASWWQYSRTSENYEDVLYFSNTYSLDGVQTYRFELSCENTIFMRIEASLKQDYCGRLNAEFRNSIKKEFPEWRIDEDNPDILIQAELEAAWGGLRPHKGTMAHLSFTRITYVKPIVFVKIIRWGTVLAEHRLKRESRHSIPLFMEKTTNEKAFMETVGNVAEEMVRFIKDPESFKPMSDGDYTDSLNY